MQYPQYGKELVKLGREDQAEIRGHYQKLQTLETKQARDKLEVELTANCRRRASHMMHILNIIGEPRISYIGNEGSQMVSLLALHSYVDEMEEVLKRFMQAYGDDPIDVFLEAIPSLTDRIKTINQRLQRYGNSWYTDAAGVFWMVPVEDFEHMNERRAAYNMRPRMRPKVLATGQTTYPLGNGIALASDQKAMTDQEHALFAQGHIRG